MQDPRLSGVEILVASKRGDLSVKCPALEYVNDGDDFRIFNPVLRDDQVVSFCKKWNEIQVFFDCGGS
jgi:hypothetical protein